MTASNSFQYEKSPVSVFESLTASLSNEDLSDAMRPSTSMLFKASKSALAKKFLRCSYKGQLLLNHPYYNKGSAFTVAERMAFELDGVLPSKINSLSDQIKRAYDQYSKLPTNLSKNSFLHSMRDQNVVLFYKLLESHIDEMFPVIYTPTAGQAIEHYSYEFRRPGGSYLTVEGQDRLKSQLAGFGGADDIDYLVISDGEAILGIGDQGVGGIGISTAKLVLMTLCAGIDPARTIPIVLDVGTNNRALLEDPLYLGVKQPRLEGDQYYAFVDKFIQAVREQFPKAVLHFEDFGIKNARTLLEKYRDEIPCFNDDIQGTGAVSMSTINAALKVTGSTFTTNTHVVIFGAGTAGVGVAEQIVDHLHNSGISKEAARSGILLVDRNGLIRKSMMPSLTEGQKQFAVDDERFSHIDCKSLKEIVDEFRPVVLIGCSTCPGAFTKEVVQTMARHVERPIILPLSNPTRLHEATPQGLLDWTDNKALVATGSHFEPCNGIDISDNNNCFIFPGIGLGAVLCRAKGITRTMISASIEELASLSPKLENPNAGLLPNIREIREVSARVATVVVLQAVQEGTADLSQVDGAIPDQFEECLEWVKSRMWHPEYRELVKT